MAQRVVRDSLTKLFGNRVQPADSNSEGGGGSVGILMPQTDRALKTAFQFLTPDHIKHFDKEVGSFMLTRIAGLLRLQGHPAVSDKRTNRDWDNPVHRAKAQARTW